MSNRPWMPLYIDDYLADTRHLTTLQHGAYLLLIMHYWARGSLPADDKQLALISSLTIQSWVRHAKPAIAPFFKNLDGRWRHKRIDKELAKREELAIKRAVFGSRGGQLRTPLVTGWQKNGNEVNSLKSNGAHQAIASPQSSNCLHNHIRKKEAAEEATELGITPGITPELEAILNKRR